MSEFDFIDQLKALATHPAARGLSDDAAAYPFGRHKLVMTHDMMVAGVHFLPDSDPADVAWKLVAVNLSDLAAKGAKPLGLLMGYGSANDAEWDLKFIAGLKDAIAHYGVPLLGGDTVSMGEGAPQMCSLTAFGEAKGHIVPGRDGALPGNAIYVTGNIGDAWAGLQIARGELPVYEVEARAALLKAYNRPEARLNSGRSLSSLVSAMMDISDGLLIDAEKIGKTSGALLEIELDKIPLSEHFKAVVGDDNEARRKAATGGDDYQLLLTASPETVFQFPVFRIGTCRAGSGVAILEQETRAQLPEILGYEHA